MNRKTLRRRQAQDVNAGSAGLSEYDIDADASDEKEDDEPAARPAENAQLLPAASKPTLPAAAHGNPHEVALEPTCIASSSRRAPGGRQDDVPHPGLLWKERKASVICRTSGGYLPPSKSDHAGRHLLLYQCPRQDLAMAALSCGRAFSLAWMIGFPWPDLSSPIGR